MKRLQICPSCQISTAEIMGWRLGVGPLYKCWICGEQVAYESTDEAPAPNEPFAWRSRQEARMRCRHCG